VSPRRRLYLVAMEHIENWDENGMVYTWVLARSKTQAAAMFAAAMGPTFSVLDYGADHANPKSPYVYWVQAGAKKVQTALKAMGLNDLAEDREQLAILDPVTFDEEAGARPEDRDGIAYIYMSAEEGPYDSPLWGLFYALDS